MQAGGPVTENTENALEPAEDDTCGTSYCLLTADHRCPLLGSVESGTLCTIQ